MGAKIGYIGNEPVYDNRMRERPAVEDARLPYGGRSITNKAVAGTGLTGEERFQRKLKSLKLEDAYPCELLVPHKGEYSQRFSWLLMDGVSTRLELIAFNERGNGIYLIYNETHWAKLGVFDPAMLRQHHCHADGCDVSVPPKLFMCRKHWSMVPKDLQYKIWEHYQAGQELGLVTPSRLYLEYTDQAKRAVRDLEAERKAQRCEREAEYQRKLF